MAVEDFPYDPEFGEPYNSRERFFVERLGKTAGWLHAGRPRREAARIALRLYVRDQLLELVDEVVRFARRHHGPGGSARGHADARPDLSAAGAAVDVRPLRAVVRLPRDARRATGCSTSSTTINRSPAGAGCVNGTRLLDDRTFVAAALGFDEVIEHTRDAMWQIDGLIHVLASASSLLSTQSKLAEDLEIWSSSEFDFVDLADAYTRSSILMPQKRNPYSLSIVRGASGVLIGRLTGFLAVAKSPSARSDNLIFAYGEVPRALDLAIRVTRLMTGVVRTLRGQRRADGRGARRRIHPGHRPERVHRADLRRRLPQRLRRGRQDRARGQPTGASPAGTSPARCSTRRRRGRDRASPGG